MKYGVVSEYVAAMAVMSKQLLNVNVSAYLYRVMQVLKCGRKRNGLYRFCSKKMILRYLNVILKVVEKKLEKMCNEYAKDAIINYLDGKDID